MAYHVVALTMAQVRSGGLAFQRELNPSLPEYRTMRVYAVSPFDLEERRRAKDRFGGDIVYFFNHSAWQACEQLDLGLQFVAEIDDHELPKKTSLVVGVPEPVLRRSEG